MKPEPPPEGDDRAGAREGGPARPVIRVMVAWATPGRQEVVTLSLPSGTTLAEAVDRSGIVAGHGIDLASVRFGVYGLPRPPGAVLKDGDRVELWRPLRVDPKEARRRRGEVRKGRGRGG